MNPLFWILWKVFRCTFVRYQIIINTWNTGILYETPERQQKILIGIGSYWTEECQPIEVIAQGRLKLKVSK